MPLFKIVYLENHPERDMPPYMEEGLVVEAKNSHEACKKASNPEKGWVSAIDITPQIAAAFGFGSSLAVDNACLTQDAHKLVYESLIDELTQ